MLQNFSERILNPSSLQPETSPSAEPGLHDRISTALKQERLDGDLLLDALHPEKNVDADGIERTIYTFATTAGAPVQVIFYPREELPIVPAVTENHQPFLLAGKPRWRNQSEIDSFEKYIFETPKAGAAEPRKNPGSIKPQTFKDQRVSFLVEQNLAYILDAAALLGGNVTKYHELRKILSAERTNDEINALIDLIIAGNLIDDSDQLKNRSDSDGNALMLLALSGQQSARRVLEHRAEVLKEITKTKKQYELQKKHELVAYFPKTLETSDLVLVHMTKYMPQKSADGSEWEMKTTYEGSHKYDPRITQHFALNHGIVDAGFENNWEQAPIAIIIPFDTAVKTNGLPANLNTADTFWEVSPGERMRFPIQGTYFIRPAPPNTINNLFTKSRNEVLYKDRDYTSQDITLLCKLIGPQGCFDLNRSISAINNDLYLKNTTTLLVTEEAQDFFRSFNYNQVSTNEKQIDIVGLLASNGIQQTVTNWLVAAGVVANKEILLKQIKESIEGHIRFQLREKIIDTEFQSLGCAFIPAWGQHSGQTDEIRALADQLGVICSTHEKASSAGIEDALRRALSDIVTGKITQKENRERVHGQFKNISQEQRRLLYELGLL